MPSPTYLVEVVYWTTVEKNFSASATLSSPDRPAVSSSSRKARGKKLRTKRRTQARR